VPDECGHDPVEEPVAITGAIERPSAMVARPLRNLKNISGGEFARWIKITTPRDRPHVIRVLRTAADVLEMEVNDEESG
jgi:hypothetical protein